MKKCPCTSSNEDVYLHFLKRRSVPALPQMKKCTCTSSKEEVFLHFPK